MSERYEVTYSPYAIKDLKGIYSYIAFSLQAATTAKKQINRIRNEIQSLVTLPERYAMVEIEPWHSVGMRKVVVDNFVVLYMVDNERQTVSIIRILYGGMDIDSVLQNTTD